MTLPASSSLERLTAEDAEKNTEGAEEGVFRSPFSVVRDALGKRTTENGQCLSLYALR